MSEQAVPDLTGIDESKGEDALVELAVGLINIESVSGREQRMAKALQAWLQARGWAVQLQPVKAVDAAAVRAICSMLLRTRRRTHP